jgi:small-conductance mechanosensitive channel
VFVIDIAKCPLEREKEGYYWCTGQALYTNIHEHQTMLNASIFTLIGELIGFIGISLLVCLIILRALSDIAKRSRLTRESIRDLQRGILAIWLALVVVWVLQALGFTSLFSSVTLSGIVGIGITLALQSTLGNLLTGIWLLSDNVLRLGDNIKIMGFEGTVMKLSFRSTWLKTSDGSIVVMSNSTLYNGPFTNFTAKERLSKKFEDKN